MTMPCRTETTTNPPEAMNFESRCHEIQELRERIEDIEDREDRKVLQAAKARQGSRPGIPWEQVKTELGIE